ncbi:hypothetical protein AHiyo8_00600 [Arthrobacter sp. Hiyo8]|nr:hypothetical protein AHiyo8_00600 [Arthrobacter sp. Hiyo8]
MKIANDPELATWSVRQSVTEILGRESLPANQLIHETFDVLTPLETFRTKHAPGASFGVFPTF